MKLLSVKLCVGKRGFTLVEILVVLLIVAVATVGMIFLQQSSWIGTRKANQTLVAGQLIERKIEALRVAIAANPAANFPGLVTAKDNTDELDSASGINVHWHVLPYPDSTHIKAGDTILDARLVKLTAVWNFSKDTIAVTCGIAKNF